MDEEHEGRIACEAHNLSLSRKLLQSLQNKNLYSHPVNQFDVIETHISWILLTGLFAYKIKKPVNLGFVDYSSLEKRRYFCTEELQLNQAFSKNSEHLYLSVVAITGTEINPKIETDLMIGIEAKTEKDPKARIDPKTGTELKNEPTSKNAVHKARLQPIEYAVKMKQFEQSQLFNHLLKQGNLSKAILKDCAKQIAHFHQNTPIAPSNSTFGDTERIKKDTLDNFEDSIKLLNATDINLEINLIDRNLADSNSNDSNLITDSLTNNNLIDGNLIAKTQSRTQLLQKKIELLLQENLSLFKQRKSSGFIRDCHGDLHLGNMVLLDSKPTIFDRVEFNADFRWIDICNEIAFIVMSLEESGSVELASYFLNQYLQLTGDYEGLALLNFYKAYRAMVRAKVALATKNSTAVLSFLHYLKYVENLLGQTEKKLIIMCGISGSGKTTLAETIASLLPAIHLRSDIERKRIMLENHYYSTTHTKATYQRLYDIAASLLQSGYNVIVDATFLTVAQRNQFQHLALLFSVPFIIINCSATKEVMTERIKKRQIEKQDASEATIEIMEDQINQYESFIESELPSVISIAEELTTQKKLLELLKKM